MSGRGGVFSKVKGRYKLADPGRKAGAMVALLDCGHARSEGAAKARRGSRMWCRLCTAAAAKVKPRHYTQAELDRAVAKALRAAQRRATPKHPPELKAVAS